MLPVKIVRLLNFFDFCGYNTASSKYSHYPNFNKNILLGHITLALILTTFYYYLWTSYLSTQDLLSIIIESLQYLAGLLTYWLIIWDSIAYRLEHQRFWSILRLIDRCYCGQSRFTFRNYKFKFIEFFSVMILIYIVRCITASWYHIIWAYLTLFLICNTRSFYYIFCLEVVRFQLEMIEYELRAMRSLLDSKQKRCHRFYSFELRRMKWLHGYFQCIHELLDCLNKIFGWSHVVAIFYTFYLILTGFIWTYMGFTVIFSIRLFGESQHIFEFNVWKGIIPRYEQFNKHFSSSHFDYTLAAFDYLFMQ